jgi:predicted  nucleic acid-binding Zn-ribbon protein
MSLMESLLNLHRVDAQVRGLRRRLESANRYYEAQTRQLEAIRLQLEELETRKKHLKASIANLETEVRGIDEQLEKFREDLNKSVTNKQYSAVLTEMNTVKAKRSELEDRELQFMEQTESLDAEIGDVQAQLDERAKVRDHAEAQLAERRDEIGERLAELEAERKEAAAAVRGPALAIFEEMAEIHDGEALAPIEEVDRRHREYACGACNMRITFEQVSNAVSGSDTIVRCTACDRILYMQDELRGALTPK